MRKNYLTGTAYHEAGHAVVAHWIDVPFKHVTIIPDEDSLGRLTHWPTPKWLTPDINLTPRIRKRLENGIMVSLAGRIAEKKYSKRNNNVGSSEDLHRAVDAASYIAGDEKNINLYLRWVQDCAEKEVDFRWNFIKAVAKNLLKRKTLSSSEVRQIIFKRMSLEVKKSLRNSK